MHNNYLEYLCRVCGWQQEEPPWGEDGKTPTFNICDCCGVEFGYEDAIPESIAKFRSKWLNNGTHWFNERKKPKDWDLLVQIARIDKKMT